MNAELRKKTAECGEMCSAKRSQTPRKGKAGNGQGAKVRRTKEDGRGNRETSKSPKSKSRGGAEEMQNADFGLRMQQSEPGAQATGHGPRKCLQAKRTHRVVSPRPQSRQAALCPMWLTGRRDRGIAECGFRIAELRWTSAARAPGFTGHGSRFDKLPSV